MQVNIAKIQGIGRTHRVGCKLVPASSIVVLIPSPEEALGRGLKRTNMIGVGFCNINIYINTMIKFSPQVEKRNWEEAFLEKAQLFDIRNMKRGISLDLQSNCYKL